MEEDGHDLTPEQKNFIPKVTPTHILMFATGACGIPAVGFEHHQHVVLFMMTPRLFPVLKHVLICCTCM